ncbi:NACHT domain-containing protein [Spirillospora sp. CA-255316]
MIAAAIVGLVLLPVTINLATDGDAPGWAIPGVFVLGVAATWLAAAQHRADRRTSPSARFPARFRDNALREVRRRLNVRLADQPGIWARIDLVDAPDRVRVPAEMTVVAEPSGPSEEVFSAFEQSSRSLLLVGAPGAGKTTQLLDLADRLLAAAETSDDQPIPVVLGLSSFRPLRILRMRRRGSGGDEFGGATRWLFKTLRAEYGLGRQVAEEWLAEHRLILLLDGLDEVPATHRLICVRWINHLQDHFKVPPMVVCSRDLDYADAGESLTLQHAVRIAPLDREKVVAWLASGGPALDHLRRAIDSDPTLWDLLDAPLWLEVLAAVSEPSRARRGSLTERRQALLDAYVDEALRRGDQSHGYTRDDVVRWLGRLAGRGDVVATRRWPGLARIDYWLLPADAERAVKTGLAGPLMAVVAVAGALVLLRHAGAAVAGAELASALIMLLVWRMTVGGSPASTVRPAGLPGLCAVVVVLGAVLSGAAMAAAMGLSRLVELFPRLSDTQGGEPGTAINWILVLVVFLSAGAVAGIGLDVVWLVTDLRSPTPWRRALRLFAVRIGPSIIIAMIFVAVAGYFLGLAYLALIVVPAPYVLTGTCALAFFAAGGTVGFLTDTLSGGHAEDESRELWVAWIAIAGILTGVLLMAVMRQGWISRPLFFHLLALGIGAGIGLYLAAQCRRLNLYSGTLTTLCLISIGYLPRNLNRFLRYAARKDLLRSQGSTYRIRHQLFAEHFANQR